MWKASRVWKTSLVQGLGKGRLPFPSQPQGSDIHLSLVAREDDHHLAHEALLSEHLHNLIQDLQEVNSIRRRSTSSSVYRGRSWMIRGCVTITMMWGILSLCGQGPHALMILRGRTISETFHSWTL